MDKAEAGLEKLVEQMTPAQRQVFDQQTKMAPPAAVGSFAAKRVRAAPPQPVRIPAAEKAQAGTAPDRIKEEKERTLVRAFRAAYGGQVPMDVLRVAFGDALPDGTITALGQPTR